ncbi:uncharacterized protein I206_100973 [Kwoniella pini CBS 10737]|uniref:Xylose isomerase-like TIM barrel domain-containing protein n=1 Tax=Kwoniella pini CBS 10737 TaxID=1296096 RepID=A0A1B9IBM5_9TREE|nr:uncharacterized protein I206_00353 [Kwoniella pini CBS 10737]OCF53052.1 hypothetical protein I206_00353 [Kwoniella pini CBS 10737]
MHKDNELGSSNHTKVHIYQQTKEQYEVDIADRLDSTLDNPFLVNTPQSNKEIVKSSSPTVSSYSQISLPGLGFSQSSISSSPIRTPILQGISDDDNSPHSLQHTPQNTIDDIHNILSPFRNFGSLTPGKQKRTNAEIDETDSLASPSTPTHIELKLELESPLSNLGLCTPTRLRLQPQYVPTSSDREWRSPLTHIPSHIESSPGLTSPFLRLGLGSPKQCISSLSPQISTSLKPDITTAVPIKSKSQLEIPSPSDIPDTPTSYRFYPSAKVYNSHPSYDLTIPKQPIFIPIPIKQSPKTPSKDIKPLLPITPPSIPKTNNNESNDQSEIKVNFLTHLSIDGGLIPSLNRLKIRMKGTFESVKGVNMFINPAKKSVIERDVAEVAEAAELMSSFGYEFRRLSMAHAVHTTNLLSSDDNLRNRSKESIITELKLAEVLGIPTLVIHLGSEGRFADEDSKIDKKRMKLLASDLLEILERTKEVILAIENTVHPSPTSLTMLQSLALLFTHISHPRLKICLDLAHLHISELDLNELDNREDLFEMLKKVGKDRIAGIHVGGCGTEHGGKSDRHIEIGFGSIKLSSIRSILRHPIFHSIPTLIETPRYFRDFRQSKSLAISTRFNNDFQLKNRNRNHRIEELEESRSELERKLILNSINISDKEWEINEYKLMIKYKKERKKIDNSIYKLIKFGKNKEFTNGWIKFIESRKKHLNCYRKLLGKRRSKVNKRK